MRWSWFLLCPAVDDGPASDENQTSASPPLLSRHPPAAETTGENLAKCPRSEAESSLLATGAALGDHCVWSRWDMPPNSAAQDLDGAAPSSPSSAATKPELRCFISVSPC